MMFDNIYAIKLSKNKMSNHTHMRFHLMNSCTVLIGGGGAER